MRGRVLIGQTSLCVFALVLVLRTVCAADKDIATPAAEKAAADKPAKAKAAKAGKKASSQLPPYYSGLINDDQREKVAATYTKFNTKLGKLKNEIKSVTAERDKALEDFLTDDQKTRLVQLKADAKAKRAKASK